MASQHPAFLVDHAAIAPSRDAVLAMREGIRTLEDYARRLQREREDVDRDGVDSQYEPLRQRERAAHDELVRARALVDRLLLILGNLEEDMRRLADAARAAEPNATSAAPA